MSVGTVEDGEYRNRAWRTQLKVDYARPIGEAKLKLGYEFNGDDNDYRLVFAATPLGAPAAIDPTRSNLFRFDQQVHGLYATYEKPFGKLTALAGVRAESTRIDLDQVTQGRKDENDYVRVYPSLNLTWRVDDAQQVTASASRRVQRPQPTEYNSLVIFLDDLNQYAGNPRLKPQITDALELGYQYRKSGSTYLATAYYRNGRDSTADVFRDLGGGSIFQTRENIGSFQSAGLELAANGKLPGRVSYNVSASLAWNENRRLGPGLRRSGSVRLFPGRPRVPDLGGHRQGHAPAPGLCDRRAPLSPGPKRPAGPREPGLPAQVLRQAVRRGDRAGRA